MATTYNLQLATYTLIGVQNDDCTSDGDIGIIGRTLQRTLQDLHIDGKIHISACEIFADGIRDIFAKRKFDTNNDYTMDSMKQRRVKVNEDIHSAIQSLRNNRSSAATELNDHSSRTHLVVQIHVSSSRMNSKIIYVDLAGFEPH